MGERLPTFSIIVPTFRRPRQVMECIEALTCLDYPPELYQVIVVESDLSSLAESLGEFQKKIPLQVISQPACGQAAARSLGAQAAQGEYLAFTDDDCRPVPGWLRSLAAQFAITPDRAVGGPVRNLLTNDPYATLTQTVIDCLYDWYNSNPNTPRYFGTNNLAVPTAQFQTLGGFDSTFRPAGEDRDFCARWLEQGYQMAYAPEAIVWHAHAMTLSTFWQQHFNYGRGSFRFHMARTRASQRAFALEPFAFYWKMLSAPFSRLPQSSQPTRVLMILLIISQVATAAGFLRQILGLVKPVKQQTPAST